MKPLYNSETGRTRRPRIRRRNIGEMPKGLQAQALKYGITTLSVGMCLIEIGVQVTNLNFK